MPRAKQSAKTPDKKDRKADKKDRKPAADKMKPREQPATPAVLPSPPLAHGVAPLGGALLGLPPTGSPLGDPGFGGLGTCAASGSAPPTHVHFADPAHAGFSNNELRNIFDMVTVHRVTNSPDGDAAVNVAQELDDIPELKFSELVDCAVNETNPELFKLSETAATWEMPWT